MLRVGKFYMWSTCFVLFTQKIFMVPLSQSCFAYHIIGETMYRCQKRQKFWPKNTKGVIEAFWEALLSPHGIAKYTSKPQSQAFGIALPLHKCEDHLSSTKKKASWNFLQQTKQHNSFRNQNLPTRSIHIPTFSKIALGKGEWEGLTFGHFFCYTLYYVRVCSQN